jgi:hypothetical protein
MNYEIKFNYNGKENKDGKFSIEAARTFAKKTARYAGNCQIVDGETVVETWEYDEEAGRVVQL